MKLIPPTARSISRDNLLSSKRELELMQYPQRQRIFCADDTLPKDDIDELFEKLLPVEPPPALIQRIITSVSRLPKPTPPSEEQKKRESMEGLFVQKDHLPPS